MIGKYIREPISKPVSWPIESGLDLGPVLPFGTPYDDFDTREQLGPDAFRLKNVSGTAAAGWNISGVAGDIIRVRAYLEILHMHCTPRWQLKRGALQSGLYGNRSNTIVNDDGTGWLDMVFTATADFGSLVILEGTSDSDCLFLSLHISKS